MLGQIPDYAVWTCLLTPIAGARILSSDSSEVTPPAKQSVLEFWWYRQPTLGVDRWLWGWEFLLLLQRTWVRFPAHRAHTSCHSSFLDLMSSSGFDRWHTHWQIYTKVNHWKTKYLTNTFCMLLNIKGKSWGEWVCSDDTVWNPQRIDKSVFKEYNKNWHLCVCQEFKI